MRTRVKTSRKLMLRQLYVEVVSLVEAVAVRMEVEALVVVKVLAMVAALVVVEVARDMLLQPPPSIQSPP